MSELLDDLLLVRDTRVRRLRDVAVRRAWDAGSALDWPSLSFEPLPPPVRRAMTEIYADVLYAETFGVGVTARMVELAPEGPLRDFARTQLADEARHVDFFTRATRLLGEPERVSGGLVELDRELDGINDYDELMLHAQIVETAAQALFVTNARQSLRRMDRGVRLPGSDAVRTLVTAVSNYVGRDESRHIAFGQAYLTGRLAGLDTRRLRALEQRVVVSATLMHAAFAGRRGVFKWLGVDVDWLLGKVWAVLGRQIARVGLDIGDAPAGAVVLHEAPGRA